MAFQICSAQSSVHIYKFSFSNHKRSGFYASAETQSRRFALLQISTGLFATNAPKLLRIEDNKLETRTPMWEMAQAAASLSDEDVLEWTKTDNRRLLHVVFRVGNLDKTIKFYTECLGMKVLRKRDIPEDGYSNAFLGYGSEDSHFSMELTYNYGVDNYDVGTGFGHFGIAVENVTKTVDLVKIKGGRVTREPGQAKDGSTFIACVEDPDGYTCELIERGPTLEPLCQVMLRVGDIERSIDFYKMAFGMELLRKRDNPEYRYTNAVMGYGPEDRNAVLVLTYNYGVREYNKGNGYAQVAIGTDNVYKTAEAIKVCGGKIIREPGPLPGINTKIAICLDPDGWKTIFSKEVRQNPVFHIVERTVREASLRLLDAFVDLAFEFVDQPLLPSQSNFAPVEEIGAAVQVTGAVTGTIPDDFTEGVYIRNGPNPLFGGLKSSISMFGKSNHTWIEGEGMLHALHVFKDSISGRWITSYNNRHVDTDTFKLEKKRKKPAFLPAIEGDSAAVLSAYLLNWLRFGLVDKYLSNTNVFEHSGKVYSISENHIPQEIDPLTLETKGNWDINGCWNRPFTSHPKKAPDTGELVVVGIHPKKPYFELGVVSADGKRLLHKVNLKLKRCCLCHEIGITKRYNVIMDFPLTIDINRLITGGPLIKYNKEGYAQIGVMPRFGDSDSVQWFKVEPSCTFHIMNCYEHGDEVVVSACRASKSIIPGPDFGLNKFEWFSKGFKPIEHSDDESFFSRVYEWRLDMITGEVTERNLTGTEYSMEFPMINGKFIGIKNKFGYAQVADLNASSISGMTKYGALAKLNFKDRKLELSNQHEGLVEVEYHKFPENTFCSGAAFVAKSDGLTEDDGWIITYVHDESTDKSHVYIVDATKFSEEPVAKISLPRRVPYGFHGTFVPVYSR